MKTMRFAGRTGATATYTLAVPVGTLRLMLSTGPKFSVTNSTGSPVATVTPAVNASVPTGGPTVNLAISPKN